MLGEVFVWDYPRFRRGWSECMQCLWGAVIDGDRRMCYCGLLRTFRRKSIKNCVLLNFLKGGGICGE